MEIRIRKWGNSLGLRIPKAFAQQMGVDAGSAVDLSVEDGDLIVRRPSIPRLRLSDLLSGVTPENVHGEIETGGPVGSEAL